MSDVPTTTGNSGIAHQEMRNTDPMRVPLTPLEIWNQAVQAQRGFSSSPSGTNDTTRGRPATIPPEAKAGDRGVRVGKGFETYAAIQVLDKDGQRVAIGHGFFDGGVSDAHAEARILTGFESQTAMKAPNGKLMVVVETDVCPGCQARLTKWAQRLGVSDIDVYVPERQSLRGSGTVTPKTASTTSLMDHGKATSVKFLRRINVPGTASTIHVPEGGQSPGLKTALAGAAIGIWAGIGKDFLKSEFKVKIRKDMQALPQIKPDRRSAPTFFSDPKSKTAMQLIDLLSMNLAKFSTDLQAFHSQTKSTFQEESAKIMISKLTDTQRVDFLDSIDTELSNYADQLLTVQDNLKAIKDVSPNWLAAAQDAEKLVRIFNGKEDPITDRIITKNLFDEGMSVEEMTEVSRRCEVFAQLVRNCLKEVDALLIQVTAMIADVNGWRDAVSNARGIIMQSILQAELKRRQSGVGSTP